jgi:hypothetical protein
MAGTCVCHSHNDHRGKAGNDVAHHFRNPVGGRHNALPSLVDALVAALGRFSVFAAGELAGRACWAWLLVAALSPVFYRLPEP